ncbi:MAG TPA: amidohydrolase family protein [Acidimicrobiales bacterium]|nr:amidohydrolase family protein [Acidimicrobiales bacterium]
MLDLVIGGGTVIDGTGRPARRADVGILDGRIVAVGAPDEPARRTIDATGLVVAPGFIDVHTHYDAQAFWDTTLSPSPLHGVTTVVGGNCGFTIAPLTPDDGDYLMRMLARVEGMPLESLQTGAPWDWRTTAEYLDRLDGTLAPNAGFMVGHSAIRRVVMHDDAVGKEATPEQLDAMKQLLAAGLAAGGLGFSSSWATTHNDHEGNPVPSRHATRDEVLALCAVVGEHPGTTLEFIPGLAPFDDDAFDLMAAMSRAANRPLNWNVLVVNSRNRDLIEHQLSASDYAAEHGAKVVALTLPDSFRSRLNFRTGFVLDTLPGWDRLMALPDDEKLAMLADPIGRAEMDRLAQTEGRVRRNICHWASYVVLETFADVNQRFTGRLVGDIARETGSTPWDTLADIVVADRLRTVITTEDRFQDDDSWVRRVEAWRDPRTVVGASDAGAHLDMIDSYSFSTTLIARAVRERSLLPLEEAVHYLTDAPAALYGLKDRGRLAAGSWGDVVVFDPETIGPGPVHTRNDLPGGASRIFGGAEGIHHVVVAGSEIVEGAEFTDARPGRILRSGRDTSTVTAG